MKLVAAAVAVSLPCYAATAESTDATALSENDPDEAAGRGLLEWEAGDSVVAAEASALMSLPTRVTLAHELSYKVRSPQYVVKNRSSVRMEYSQYLLDNFVVQLDTKASAFWSADHRHAGQDGEIMVSQAYIQTSLGQTSIRAGYQSLPWGESILAPVTDEISPRDNRELFNFNLEELRLGQPMLVVDQYSKLGQWTGFVVPRPALSKSPQRGTAYFFDSFQYSNEKAGQGDAEYGAAWRKVFASADLTLMAARLVDNDYALRAQADGRVRRQMQRFTMVGGVFNYAMKDIVVRGEAAWKSPQAYSDTSLQIIRRDQVDAYLAIEYAPSSSFTLSIEAINQRIVHWDAAISSAPRERRSLLLSVTKLLMHDDLAINVMNFYSLPRASNLAVLQMTHDWSDNLRWSVNVTHPHTSDKASAIWAVRDQHQVSFKIQYLF